MSKKNFLSSEKNLISNLLGTTRRVAAIAIDTAVATVAKCIAARTVSAAFTAGERSVYR